MNHEWEIYHGQMRQINLNTDGHKSDGIDRYNLLTHGLEKGHERHNTLSDNSMKITNIN